MAPLANAEPLPDELPPPSCLQVDLDLKKSQPRDWIERNITPHFSWVLGSKNKNLPQGFPDGPFKYRRVCQVYKSEVYLALVTFSDKIGGLCRPTAADSYFAQLFQYDPETKAVQAVWLPPIEGNARLWNARFSAKSGCDAETEAKPPLVEFSNCIDCEDSTIYSARLKFEKIEKIVKKKVDGKEIEEKVIEKKWSMRGGYLKSDRKK